MWRTTPLWVNHLWTPTTLCAPVTAAFRYALQLFPIGLTVQSMSLKNTLINAYDASGFAPLHHAAKQGNVKMVEFLLSHGADVGAITKGDSLVSLHLACQYNHRDVSVRNLVINEHLW